MRRLHATMLCIVAFAACVLQGAAGMYGAVPRDFPLAVSVQGEDDTLPSSLPAAEESAAGPEEAHSAPDTVLEPEIPGVFAEESEGGEEEAAAPQPDIEQVVYTYGELRDALADPVIEIIYLGADITTETGGAIINPLKPRLVLDGIDPDNPEDGRHTLVELGSTAQNDTMTLRSNSGPKDILVRNLIVRGGNYYGFINIYNEAKNVTLTYRDVEYIGPQITWNRYGTAHYIDCVISIGKHGRAPDLGEVAEALHIKLEGNIHISQSEGQVNELFFIDTGAGTIEILPGANVEASTYGESGFVYCSTIASSTLTVGEGARFHYTAPRRFYDGYALAGITVEAGAEMTVTITGRTQVDVIRVRGDLTVMEDATLLVLPYGTYGATDHNSLTIIGGGTAKFQNPKCVALYGGIRRPLYFRETAGSLHLEAQQFNYWDTAAAPGIAGGPDDFPKYDWMKPSGANFTLNGSVSQGDSGNFTSFTSNYDPEDTSVNVVPTSSTVSLVHARALSLGRLYVTAEYLPGILTGITEPDALVRARYTTVEGLETVTDTVTAGEDGGYTISIDTATVDAGTTITVTSSYNFLYADVIVNAAPGEIALDVAPLLFPTTPISPASSLVQRKNESWGVTITDTRGTGSSWKLLLRLASPLTPEGGATAARPVLTNALRFGDETGTLHILSADADVFVAGHTAVEPLERHHITWPDEEGLLLLVPPSVARADTAYHGVVRWTLQDTP